MEEVVDDGGGRERVQTEHIDVDDDGRELEFARDVEVVVVDDKRRRGFGWGIGVFYLSRMIGESTQGRSTPLGLHCLQPTSWHIYPKGNGIKAV
jgi:hypothetical protein